MKFKVTDYTYSHRILKSKISHKFFHLWKKCSTSANIFRRCQKLNTRDKIIADLAADAYKLKYYAKFRVLRISKLSLVVLIT